MMSWLVTDRAVACHWASQLGGRPVSKTQPVRRYGVDIHVIGRHMADLAGVRDAYGCDLGLSWLK